MILIFYFRYWKKYL